MSSKPLDANGITFVFHVQELWLDSYTIAKPELTHSGNWEVWSVEAEGAEQAQTIDEIEFLAENRLLEIITEEELSYEIVRGMIAAFQIGEQYGAQSAKKRHQLMVKYAFAAISGEISDTELEDVADSHYHRLGQTLG